MIPRFTAKVLNVDLSSGSVKVETMTEETVRLYLGGRGINAKIILDQVESGIKAYDPQNPLIFGAGSLSGTLAPASSRTRLTTVSPLTGLIGDSSIGGHWGPELRYAGLDHVVVIGRAEEPVYIHIHDCDYRIVSAEGIWGSNTREASGLLKKGVRDSEAQVLCIGPAGENLVRNACVVGDGYNAAGRTGIGAVMGSKNLKAIVVRGSGGIQVSAPRSFERAALRAHEKIKGHPLYAEYLENGVLGHYGENNPDVPSASIFLENYVYKRKTCFGCPLHCMYYYAVSEGPQAGCFSGNFPVNPVIEFGSKLKVKDWPQILRLVELCAEYGLDLDGIGSTILYALELAEAGILNEKDCSGLEMAYGDFNLFSELMRLTTFREGIGDLMADGSRMMAKKIGGEASRYTREVKGLELMPGRLPHYFNALAHGVSGRGGCHTRSQCFMVSRYVTPERAMESFGSEKAAHPEDPEGKALMLTYYEDLIAVADSLGICSFFTSEMCPSLGFEELAELLAKATGWGITPEELRECGERIITLERLNNLRQGLTRRYDIPAVRLVATNQADYSKVERDLGRMVDDYYDLRGWDDSGVPRKDTLRKLEISEGRS